MTQIAQKIDFENRELQKKNVELNIQVKSQEQDREILLQQLLYEKKQGQKLQVRLNKLKEKAEVLEKQQLEEQDKNDNEYNAQNQPRPEGNNQWNEAQQNPLVMNARLNIHGIGSVQSSVMKSQQLPSIMKSMQSVGMGSRQGRRVLHTAGKNEPQNPKIARFEQLIDQLKSMVNTEKKNVFQIKTLYATEMEIRKQLESILRLSIEDVRDEITRKRNETQSIYKQLKKNLKGIVDQAGPQTFGDQISVQEKERIIEVLLSQERVLTLLYDKTFPPRKEMKSA